jgi:hypothetical protein
MAFIAHLCPYSTPIITSLFVLSASVFSNHLEDSLLGKLHYNGHDVPAGNPQNIYGSSRHVHDAMWTDRLCYTLYIWWNKGK